MGKIMKNGRSYSGWGSPGGGGASGPIVWVETQEASPAYPYRELISDAIESGGGQSTVTGLYTFFNTSTQESANVNITVAVNYFITQATQEIDNVYMTENISQNDTSGSPFISASIASVAADDPNVSGISFSWAESETFSDGKIYAFMPSQITFLYDGVSVTAYYQGLSAKVQVGTYSHTQTTTKYSLGTQS